MSDFLIEEELYRKKYKAVCGVDEVGRGALFGPVVVGAVILNPKKLHQDIEDSKKLSPKKRKLLASFIYAEALACSIGWSCNEVIDKYNILQATKMAVLQSIKNLQIAPDFVLIDGMKTNFLNIEAKGIVKGDRKSMSIAAASIIAKVFRDDLLKKMGEKFPCYFLEKNFGYGTKKHIETIKERGFSLYHRKSFRIKKWEKEKVNA